MRDEAVHSLLVAEQMRLEPERMACEARYVAALNWKDRTRYLDSVTAQRGKADGEALRVAVAQVQAVPA